MKRRKLTPFLAHEMLYDYATNQLDGDRRAAIEEFLMSDRESQTILANIQAAIAYSNLLVGTDVDPEILSHLKEAESAISLGKKYSSWAEWPESLRWSLTAIGLSALVAGVVAVVPWSNFSKKMPVAQGPQTIEIAQIPQPSAEDVEAAQNAVADNESSGDEAPDDSGDEGSGDEHEVAGGGAAAHVAQAKLTPAPLATAEVTPTPAPAPPAVLPPVAAEEPPQDESLQTASRSGVSSLASYTPYFLSRATAPQFILVTLRFAPAAVVPPNPLHIATPVPVPSLVAKTEPKIIPKSIPPIPIPTTAILVSSEGSDVRPGVASDSGAPNAQDPKAKGFVYRAFMTLSDLDDLGPKITDDLISLGAEKAGEVELGWKRGSGRYYHFALPAENEQKVLEKLQVYGPVRISKDPHPRVMPKGQVRFILWVESTN